MPDTVGRRASPWILGNRNCRRRGVSHKDAQELCKLGSEFLLKEVDCWKGRPTLSWNWWVVLLWWLLEWGSFCYSEDRGVWPAGQFWISAQESSPICSNPDTSSLHLLLRGCLSVIKEHLYACNSDHYQSGPIWNRREQGLHFAISYFASTTTLEQKSRNNIARPSIQTEREQANICPFLSVRLCTAKNQGRKDGKEFDQTSQSKRLSAALSGISRMHVNLYVWVGW